MSRTIMAGLLAAVIGLSGCATAPPVPPSTPLPDVQHHYELTVNDSAKEPLEGVKVSFLPSISTGGSSKDGTQAECITDKFGKCSTSISIFKRGVDNIDDKSGKVVYSANKSGYFPKSGEMSSSFSYYDSLEEKTIKKSLILYKYKSNDYFTEEFLNSSVDKELREKALEFISLIQLQSLMVGADVVFGGVGTSNFKEKKYFKIKINTATVFNNFKMDKYDIAKRVFDDSIREMLNTLSDTMSSLKAIYGYDLIIYGSGKNFSNEGGSNEKIEYRFLIPKAVLQRYKNKDISGQQLLDASVLLIDDKSNDYFTEEFLNSSVDKELREQALEFICLIQRQSLIVGADVVLGGVGTSKFKEKKYFQIKINTTTVFNNLKMNKYDVAKRIFDDSIRKILNPLNDNMSSSKLIYGYDLIIYGYSKNFLNEGDINGKIEYRFFIPKTALKRYKDKDISGQQLLDASVLLMDDERIELKLQ